MKSRQTCHRAVSPKITPYCCSLICCRYLYLVALHFNLSLNSGTVTLSRKLSTARCHLVQAMVYFAKRKMILSLVLHWIIKINGLNPLSHGALCQKHVFGAFWNFCAGMLTKLIPIYSKRHLQHDSIPFFPLAPRFTTFSELHVKKTVCSLGTSTVSSLTCKFLSSLAPWARALARCPPTKFLMTTLKRVNFWWMGSVWMDLDKNYKF